MLFAYSMDNATLTRLADDAPLETAHWVDLYRPQPEQVARVEALGFSVPTLAIWRRSRSPTGSIGRAKWMC